MHTLHVLGIVSEDENVQRVLVKQSYPLKTGGEQSCESARKNAMEEVSRVITGDGTVIRMLLDGGTQVIVSGVMANWNCGNARKFSFPPFLFIPFPSPPLLSFSLPSLPLPYLMAIISMIFLRINLPYTLHFFASLLGGTLLYHRSLLS